MKGRWIYFAVAGLSGLLAAFFSIAIFLPVFIVLMVFLYYGKRVPFTGLVMCIMIFSSFFIRAQLAEGANHTKLPADLTHFAVRIQDDLKIDGDLLTVKALELTFNENLIIRYKIKSENEKIILSKSLQPGLACTLLGSLDVPSVSTNQNSFDYKNYLQSKHIYWILNADQMPLSTCMDDKKTPQTYFQSIRWKGIQYIMEYFPKETGPLAAALIFGSRDFIQEDVLVSYQKLGIVHLLAISGLHVGMLAGMIYYLGIRSGVTRERMTTVLLLFLPVYALLTGAAPSIIRAVLMMELFLLLKKWNHLYTLQTLDIFAIVFMAYTFLSPFILYDAGFQLSFTVSISLLLSAPILLARFSNPIILLIITSIICQLAAVPIMLYFFFEFSIISILANLIYIPIFSFLLLPGLFILFLLHTAAGQSINILIWPIDFIIHSMDTFAGKLAQFPLATITLGRPPFIFMMLYLAAIWIFFHLWESHPGFKRLLFAFFFPLGIFLFHGLFNTFSPQGEVTFIDVGQGESIFIRLPYGKGNYLIDTGGTISFTKEAWKEKVNQYEVGKDVVVPFLKSKGVTTIHKLILTHGDADHIGGASAVIRNIKVNQIIFPAYEDPSELEKELIVLANAKRIPYLFTSAGMGWTAGGTTFNILSPMKGMSTERNDSSIVLWTRLGGLTWLFTGDLEKTGEEKLLARYKSLQADVLKAGHHGSKTSTSEAFLKKVRAKITIISAGKNNRFGHPNKEVLNALEERKIKIFRTDQHGGITYLFKGNRGTFFTQMP